MRKEIINIEQMQKALENFKSLNLGSEIMLSNYFITIKLNASNGIIKVIAYNVNKIKKEYKNFKTIEGFVRFLNNLENYK